MHKVQCLLWDFGDTLCDEQSLWRVSPEWMAVYESFDVDDGIGAAWNLGALDTHEVVTRLAKQMGLSESEIHEHLARVDLFDFFPFTYDFFRAMHLPQAIVTVNPAKFREMAIELALDDFCETIVVSGEEKVLDKGALCEIALRRMTADYKHEHTLLIDNKQANLDAWSHRGGLVYLYTKDQTFERDLARGIDALMQS